MVRVTDENGIRVIQLDDAAGRNALNEEMVDALVAALQIPDDTRCVVLAGHPDGGLISVSRDRMSFHSGDPITWWGP